MTDSIKQYHESKQRESDLFAQKRALEKKIHLERAKRRELKQQMQCAYVVSYCYHADGYENITIIQKWDDVLLWMHNSRHFHWQYAMTPDEYMSNGTCPIMRDNMYSGYVKRVTPVDDEWSLVKESE